MSNYHSTSPRTRVEVHSLRPPSLTVVRLLKSPFDSSSTTSLRLADDKQDGVSLKALERESSERKLNESTLDWYRSIEPSSMDRPSIEKNRVETDRKISFSRLQIPNFLSTVVHTLAQSYPRMVFSTLVDNIFDSQ
ncbi:hypothetical protein JCM5350_001102 [Sporobolomyces pararoseus]